MVVRGSARKKRYLQAGKDIAMSARSGEMRPRDVVQSKYVMDATIRWISRDGESAASSDKPDKDKDGGKKWLSWSLGMDNEGPEELLKLRRQAMQSAHLEIGSDEEQSPAARDEAATRSPRVPTLTRQPSLPMPAASHSTLDGASSFSRALSSFDYDSDLRMTIRTLEPLFNLSALEPPGFLDRFVENYHEAMQRMRWSSSFFTSTPFTASLSKRVVRVFVFILGLGCLLSCLAGILIAIPNQPSLIRPLLEFSTFRFAAKTLRNGDSAADPMIQKFGLTDNGLPLEDRFMVDANYTVDGSTMMLTFPGP